MMDHDFKTALRIIVALTIVLAIIGVLTFVLHERMVAYFFFLLVGICLLVIGGLLVASSNHQRKIHGPWR